MKSPKPGKLHRNVLHYLCLQSIFPIKCNLFDPQFRLFVSGNLEHQTGKLTFSGTGLKSFKNKEANHTDVLDISGLQVNTEFDGDFGRPESLKHIKFDTLVDKIAFQKDKKDKGIRATGIYFELPVTYPFKNIKNFGRAGQKKLSCMIK